MTVDDFNKAPDTSTTGNAALPNTYSTGCGYRLPCGLCTLLNRACPMQSNGYAGPIWKLPDITCTGDPPVAHYTEIKG